MTNTSDFRRYTYASDTNNLISSFNLTRGSQAPKLRPEVQEPEQELRVRNGKAGIKSRKQLLSEQKAASAKVVRIAACAIICMLMIGAVLNSLAVKNQLTREIAKKEVAIANAQSEYISLESKLNSLVSISMIDKYAVEELGMTKVRSNQIQYMDVNEFITQRDAAIAEAEAAAAAEAEAQKEAEGETQEEQPAEESGEEVINN